MKDFALAQDFAVLALFSSSARECCSHRGPG